MLIVGRLATFDDCLQYRRMCNLHPDTDLFPLAATAVASRYSTYSRDGHSDAGILREFLAKHFGYVSKQTVESWCHTNTQSKCTNDEQVRSCMMDMYLSQNWKGSDPAALDMQWKAALTGYQINEAAMNKESWALYLSNEDANEAA